MMVYRHCNNTIGGATDVGELASGPNLTWRQWLGAGWRLFKSDAGDLFSLLTTWQRRAAMRHHMRTLDRRMLKDIGVSPADMEAEARKPFWRE